MNKGSFLHMLSNTVGFVNVAILTGGSSISVLICISFMTRDIGHC